MTTKPTPKIGEVWHWHHDESGCHEIYGAGIVLGFKEGYDYQSDERFVTFHFANKGVLNLPTSMVKRFMYLTS